MASTNFTPSEGNQGKSRHRPDDDSFNRLFGAVGPMTPRGKNHQKSNILFSEPEKTNGVVVENGANGHANGVNGTAATNSLVVPTAANGTATGSISGSATPNGSIKGDHKTISDVINGSNGKPGTPSTRNPPGGRSSKLW